MGERLKHKLLETDGLADLVAGPDAYRDLPNLISAVNSSGEKAMNVQLSVEETYADIVPVRKEGAHAAFVTIMRGCDNACSFCIVPYTRGRERSRDPASIEYEVRLLSEQGVKEVRSYLLPHRSPYDPVGVVNADP
jgi:tRNA A37 methylthiotransferase MiaB